MSRNLLIAGSFFGMLAVIMGAFAAHGLKPILTTQAISIFETGVKYQMYSALFLLIVGGLPVTSEKVKKACFYLTTIGILLFSGSIYLLATNALTSFDFRVIGFITPLGGILLIVAWIVLLVSSIKLKNK
jgi:uncharacterized membrane protein YgdD (TMEM256/DUF423 family)